MRASRWFRDFADGSPVATVDDELVGFLTGYRHPEKPETYVLFPGSLFADSHHDEVLYRIGPLPAD